MRFIASLSRSTFIERIAWNTYTRAGYHEKLVVRFRVTRSFLFPCFSFTPADTQHTHIYSYIHMHRRNVLSLTHNSYVVM